MGRWLSGGTLSVWVLFLFSCGGDSSSPTSSSPPPDVPTVDDLRLNQLQVIGSHNSYKIGPKSALLEFMLIFEAVLPAKWNPKELDYTHEELASQLSQYRMRSFEIDVYRDPDGGRFYNRQGEALIGGSGASGIPALLDPGPKVLHIPDIDYRSHHDSFRQALKAFQAWSDANPNHFPIFVLIDAKESDLDEVLPGLGFAKALAWDSASLDILDTEINAILGDRVFRPDQLRGEAETLPQAISTSGWPTVGELRGKFLFVLLGSKPVSAYLEGHPALAGRTLFVFSQPGNPETAFVKADDPVENFDAIGQDVSNGYIVRTRSDAGTWEARSGDTTRRESALASGAQIISTDYYRPDARAPTSDGWTDYSVQYPDDASARVNPLSGPGDFLGLLLVEDQVELAP